MRRLATLLALLAPATALAQVEIEFGTSPNPVGSGARALGIGSAFIATADDATAASWNPAGLIALERPEASVVLSLKNRNELIQGLGIDEDDELQRYTYGDVNYVSVAYPFKIGSRFFVASLNYQALVDFNKNVKRSYLSSGPGLTAETFVDYRQTGALRALTPALAFQASPSVSLGLALTLWTDKLGWRNGWRIAEDVTIDALVFGNPVTTTQTIRQHFGMNGIGANLGVLWDIDQRWTFGAVLKTPVFGSLEHRWGRFDVDGVPAEGAGRTYDESLRMPPAYGAGVAYRHSDELTVSADVYRIEWGLFRHERTDIAGEKFVVNPVSNRGYDDSGVSAVTQAHVGAEKLFIFERTVVPLRGGLFYDPEPLAGATNHFLGLAAGSGVSIGDTIVDVAYQLRFAASDAAQGASLQSSEGVTTRSTQDGLVWQHLLYVSAIQHF